MATPPYAGAQDLSLLNTKPYIPPPLPNLVERPRLVKRLDEGLRLGHRPDVCAYSCVKEND